MKLQTYLFAAGVAIIAFLLVFAIKTHCPLETEYQRCLKKLMQMHDLPSEAVACAKFEKLALAKVKIAEANRVQWNIDRLTKDPAPQADGIQIKRYQGLLRDLEAESWQLLAGLQKEIRDKQS